MGIVRLSFFSLLSSLSLMGGSGAAAEESAPPIPHESRWSLGLYMGVNVENDMITVPANLHKTDYGFRLWAIGGSYMFAYWGETLGFDVELQYAKHYRGNNHGEFNASIGVSFLPLPWDQVVETSVTVGAGLSLATEVPRFEKAHFKDYNELLMYGRFEVDCFIPQLPRVGALARLHHRSGLYGTFNGVYAGSNFVAVGIKLRL